MSEQHFAKTTRRDFLGSATLATAATLTVPGATEVLSAGNNNSTEQTKVAQATTDPSAELMARSKKGDWTKPAAMAIPKEGYFELEQGRYGPIFPKTPANYGCEGLNRAFTLAA